MAVTISALSLPAPRCDRNSSLPWIGDNFPILEFLFAVWSCNPKLAPWILAVDTSAAWCFLELTPAMGIAPPEFHLANKASRLARRWLAHWRAARNKRTCRSLQRRRFPKHLLD